MTRNLPSWRSLLFVPVLYAGIHGWLARRAGVHAGPATPALPAVES